MNGKTSIWGRIRLRPALTSVALVLACACGVLASCGAGAQQPPADPAVPGAVAAPGTPGVAGTPSAPQSGSLRSPDAPIAGAPFHFFSPSSFWNAPPAVSAPLASNSAELVSALDAEVATEQQTSNGPWIDTTSYSVPVYTVSARQPTVRVTLDGLQRAPALQAAFDAVPLPAGAQPAVGSDSVLAVWQPSTERLWEFWRIVDTPAGWRASWGGAMNHVSSSPGVYGTGVWPGAKPWWGSSASSMAIVGGLITLEDLKAGGIDHALAMAIPEVRAGVYASPAQRADGKSLNPLALPEGTHLRLNPQLNLAALHLPHFTQMIAEAAQRYGIFVRDKARNVTFYAQDPIPTGTEPYAGPTGYFEGRRPSQLLLSFPWSELQVLKPTLHRIPTASERRRLAAQRRARRQAARRRRRLLHRRGV